MAATFVSWEDWSYSGASGDSQSLNLGTGTNRLLLVGIASPDYSPMMDPLNRLDSITVGGLGTGWSISGELQHSVGNSGVILYQRNLADGALQNAQTIAFQHNSAQGGTGWWFAACFSGVDTAGTPVSQVTTDEDTGTGPATVTVAASNDHIVVGMAICIGTITPTNSPTASKSENGFASSSWAAGVVYKSSPGASYAPTFTVGTSNWTAIGARVNGIVTPSGNPHYYYLQQQLAVRGGLF